MEIIGNIMEISNLLNKKASGDKEVPADGEGPEAPITKKEISLPILCNASNGSALGIPERTTSKLAQGSPAVARIAPQRAQISKQLKAPGPPKELLQSVGGWEAWVQRGPGATRDLTQSYSLASDCQRPRAGHRSGKGRGVCVCLAVFLQAAAGAWQEKAGCCLPLPRDESGVAL